MSLKTPNWKANPMPEFKPYDDPSLQIAKFSLNDDQMARLYPTAETAVEYKAEQPGELYVGTGERLLHVCNTCTHCVTQVYDGEFQTQVGRCTLVAFYKAGVAKLESVVTERGNIKDVRYDLSKLGNVNNHYPAAKFDSLVEEGYFNYDLIDIRLVSSFLRACPNWTNPLYYAQTLMARDNLKVEDLVGTAAPHIKLALKYLERGERVPFTEIQPSTLGSNQPEGCQTHRLPVVDDLYMEAGQSCSSCRYYKPELDGEGRPVPMTGKCIREDSGGVGLFSLLASVSQKTYSWYCCTDYTMEKEIQKKVITQTVKDLPPRMTAFLAINPTPRYDDLSWFNYLYKSHLVASKPSLGSDEHQLKMDLNLDYITHTLYRNTKISDFNRSMDLTCVQEHFSLGLKRNNKDIKGTIKKYSFYRDSDSLYFNGEPTEFREIDKDEKIRKERAELLGEEYAHSKDSKSLWRPGVDRPTPEVNPLLGMNLDLTEDDE